MDYYNVNIDNIDDNFIYSASQKICTQIVREQDEATLKAIQRYCEENNIIPNIINADKLELVLRLGIAELNRRELDKFKSEVE